MTLGLERVTAGDVGVFRGGSGFPVRFQGRKSGDLPFFKVSDMNRSGNELFMHRANNYIDEIQRKSMGAARISAHAIVFAKVGAAIFLERKRLLPQDSCIDNNMAAFMVDPHRLDVRFTYYLLSAFKMSSLVATTALPSLNNGQLRSIPLLVPTDLREQRRIASMLRDVDAMISALDCLIAKKQAIKQGMMQQLLTGRTRLPGFVAPWSNTKVGKLLEFKNGLNKGSEYFGSGTPIINFMDVMNGPIVEAVKVAGRVTLTRDEIKRLSARRGDLFFTRTSETVNEVGTAAVLIDDIPDACFSGFILRGRPRSSAVDSQFIARAFQIDTVRSQVKSAATYTTRALTNGRSLGSVVLALPCVEEQRAISRVLAAVDAELEALGARLAKARTMKTGMMQQLLTGRARLTAEDAV